MSTIQQLASTFSSMFVCKERPDGSTFTTSRDDAPDALCDLIREAHGDMLPDDHRYEMIRDAIAAIAEMPDDTDEDGARELLYETEPIAYTADRTAWLASHGHRPDYCDEAAAEYGPAESILDTIAWGWLAEFHEVAESVLSSLLKLTRDDEADETDAA